MRAATGDTMGVRLNISVLAFFLLLPGCGKLENRADRDDGVSEPGENGSMVELAQFLDEREARVLNVDYQSLRDPFSPAPPVVAKVSPKPMPVAVSRERPEPPMLRLCGISHVRGAGAALIDGTLYTAGEKVGPFLLQDVAHKSIIVSRGGDQWVVPVGGRLRRDADMNGAR